MQPKMSTLFHFKNEIEHFLTVFTQYMLSLDLFIVHLMLTSEVLTLNHFLSMYSVRMEANHHVDKGPSLF